nr:hypothetical protein [Chloroflexota bacterium]
MQNSVAAIRAARVTARFVLPPAQQRERHLGLHRLAFTPVRQAPAGGRGTLRSLAGLLGMNGLVPAPLRKPATSPLRRAPHMTWS